MKHFTDILLEDYYYLDAAELSDADIEVIKRYIPAQITDIHDAIYALNKIKKEIGNKTICAKAYTGYNRQRRICSINKLISYLKELTNLIDNYCQFSWLEFDEKRDIIIYKTSCDSLMV